jgi:CRISPR-associated protein Csy3
MTIEKATVLAFECKLANSDALMHAGNWKDRSNGNNWKPIAIQSKGVRGTISNRLKNAIQNDPAKLDAEIEKPNLQRVDVAALPFDSNTLRVSFSIRFLGNLSKPSACNSESYRGRFEEIVKDYTNEHAFNELATRYATNIANGRFLWRNRVGVEAVEVRVKHMESEWIFDVKDHSLRSFSEPTGNLSKLADVIRQGLMGTGFSFLQVEAFVHLGAGQEVFPSQELILDKEKEKEKSKTLYHVNDVAALHSQKIGNALRTIDTWYPEAHELGPISVEPYGSVTNRGRAYRTPKQEIDFFTLLDRWISGKKPSSEQQHFVIATLLRGGVFGEKGE